MSEHTEPMMTDQEAMQVLSHLEQQIRVMLQVAPALKHVGRVIKKFEQSTKEGPGLDAKNAQRRQENEALERRGSDVLPAAKAGDEKKAAIAADVKAAERAAAERMAHLDGQIKAKEQRIADLSQEEERFKARVTQLVG